MVPRIVLEITLWGGDTECGNGQQRRMSLMSNCCFCVGSDLSGAFLPQHGYLA